MYRLYAALAATWLASTGAPKAPPPEQGADDQCPQSPQATAARFRARLSDWEHDQQTVYAKPGERMTFTILASDVKGWVRLRQQSRLKGDCRKKYVRIAWDNSSCGSELGVEDVEETCCNPLGCDEAASRWMYAWMDSVTLGYTAELKAMLPPTGTVEFTEWDGTRITYTRSDPAARLTRFAQAIPHWELSDIVTCETPQADHMECTIGGGGTYYKMFWKRAGKTESEATARWFLSRIVGDHH